MLYPADWAPQSHDDYAALYFAMFPPTKPKEVNDHDHRNRRAARR